MTRITSTPPTTADRRKRAREVLITHRAAKPLTPLFDPLDPAAIREVARGIREIGEGSALREVIDQLVFENAENPGARPRIVMGLHDIDPSLTLSLLPTCRHPDEYRARALAFHHVGWTSRSEAALDAGIEAFPAAFVLHQLRGDLAWDRGDRERARRAYTSYMKLLRSGRVLPGIGRARGRLEAMERRDPELVTEVTVLRGWRRLVLVGDEPELAPGSAAGGLPRMVRRLASLGGRWGWPFRAVVAAAPGDQDAARWVAECTGTELMPAESIARGTWALSVEGFSTGTAAPATVAGLRARDVPVVRFAFEAAGEEGWTDPPELIGRVLPAGASFTLPEVAPPPRPTVTEIPVHARPLRTAPDPARQRLDDILRSCRAVMEVLGPGEPLPPWLEELPAGLRLTAVLQQWRGWSWRQAGARKGEGVSTPAGVAVTEITQGGGAPTLATVAARFLDGEKELAGLACATAREATLAELRRRLAMGPESPGGFPEIGLVAASPAFAHLVLHRLHDVEPARAWLDSLRAECRTRRRPAPDPRAHPRGPVGLVPGSGAERETRPERPADPEDHLLELQRSESEEVAAARAVSLLASAPDLLAKRLASLLDRAHEPARRGILTCEAILGREELAEPLRRWLKHQDDLAGLRVAVARLAGDEDFSQMGLPSPSWTPTEVSAWVAALDRRPHLLEERYLSLPDLDPFQRLEMARLLHVHRTRPSGPRGELEVDSGAWDYLVDMGQRGPYRGIAFAALLRIPDAVGRETLLLMARDPGLDDARDQLITVLAADSHLRVALGDHLGRLEASDRQVFEAGIAAWVARALLEKTRPAPWIQAAVEQAGPGFLRALETRLPEIEWPTAAAWSNLSILATPPLPAALTGQDILSVGTGRDVPHWVSWCLALEAEETT